MKVSIIIPVRNDQRISECIEALLCQEYENYEIIVVENDSQQPLKSIIEKYPVKYVCDPIIGSYHARNTGIGLATNEIIAFTDADCIADKNWLGNIVSGFEGPSIGGVGGRTINKIEKNKVVQCQRNIQLRDGLAHLSHIFPAPFAPTCNVAYRLDVLKKLQGFDNDFFSGGDVDMSWRMSLLGYKLNYARSAIIHFGCRTTFRDYYRQYYNYGKGHALLFKKYKQYSKKKMVICPYSSNLLVKSLKMMLRGIFHGERGNYYYHYWLGCVESFALIAGGIVGSIKNKVVFSS